MKLIQKCLSMPQQKDFSTIAISQNHISQYLNRGSVDGVPLQTEPDEETCGGPIGRQPSGTHSTSRSPPSSTPIDDVREWATDPPVRILQFNCYSRQYNDKNNMFHSHQVLKLDCFRNILISTVKINKRQARSKSKYK